MSWIKDKLYSFSGIMYIAVVLMIIVVIAVIQTITMLISVKGDGGK